MQGEAEMKEMWTVHLPSEVSVVSARSMTKSRVIASPVHGARLHVPPNDGLVSSDNDTQNLDQKKQGTKVNCGRGGKGTALPSAM